MRDEARGRNRSDQRDEVSPQELAKRVTRVERLLNLGGEDHFITAWGRMQAALAARGWTLVGSVILNVALVAALLGGAWLYSRRPFMVYRINETTGQVVPLDPRAFLDDKDDSRSQAEIRGFALQWVRDAFQFTPQDTKEKSDYALRVVFPAAQGSAKAAMRPLERSQLVTSGWAAQIIDDPEKKILPEAQILRTDPLEVLVTAQRRAVDSRTGEVKSLQPIAVRLSARLVPRSAYNCTGLMISDVTATTN